jgi:hypothetical protein
MAEYNKHLLFNHAQLRQYSVHTVNEPKFVDLYVISNKYCIAQLLHLLNLTNACYYLSTEQI